MAAALGSSIMAALGSSVYDALSWPRRFFKQRSAGALNRRWIDVTLKIGSQFAQDGVGARAKLRNDIFLLPVVDQAPK
jgi:hypothetical protein